MSIEELKEAIDEYFNDLGRDPQDTANGLLELADHVTECLDALREDGWVC